MGIGDYAIIGDCHSAALVSRSGSIDWLCWPRFDSDAVFAALLDPKAGRYSIAPVGPFRSRRHYVKDTNVLVTEFETTGGRVRLTDLMPVASEENKAGRLVPDHEIIRFAECLDGQVELEIVYDPRPNFGARRPRLRQHGKLGLVLGMGARTMILHTTAKLAPRPEGGYGGRVVLRAGESISFSLLWVDEGPGVLAPPGPLIRQAIGRTIAWWRGWSNGCTYRGPYRDAVIRSALVLKLMTYSPSGAIVAAPTTSLPERPGGNLNWDYRFCWLRDAALTARALFGLGFQCEAEAFVTWLLHTTRLTRPRLRILYDVYGENALRERELDLEGYEHSRPVRVGNGARDQLQLDVYGEVIDATTHFIASGNRIDKETRRMLRRFGDYVCKHWDDPDEGIWEERSGRKRHTYSRVMCWVALDRLLQLHAKGHLNDIDEARYQRERERIREATEHLSWSPAIQSYVREIGRPCVDAVLLLLPWYGFEKADSPRMRATHRRIRERLSTPNGLVYRYRTGDSPGEGAFGVCAFWACEYLALGGGTLDEAKRAFEHVLGFANDVGLFGEEMDARTGEPLGNFPQAFTHIGLINAALTLDERRKRGHAEPPSPEVEPAAPVEATL